MVRVILNSIKMVKHEMKVLGDEKYGDEYQNECKELKVYYDQLLKKDVISQLIELPDDYKKMVEQVYFEDEKWADVWRKLKYPEEAGMAAKKAIERAIKNHRKLER